MSSPLFTTCQMMMSHDSRAHRHPNTRRRQPHLFTDIPLSPPKYAELHYEVKYASPREEEVARVETLPTEHMQGDLGEKQKKTSCCALM